MWWFLDHFFCLVCGPLEKKKLIRPNLACEHVPGTVCMCVNACMQGLLLPVGRGFISQCVDIGAHEVISGRVLDLV